MRKAKTPLKARTVVNKNRTDVDDRLGVEPSGKSAVTRDPKGTAAMLSHLFRYPLVGTSHVHFYGFGAIAVQRCVEELTQMLQSVGQDFIRLDCLMFGSCAQSFTREVRYHRGDEEGSVTGNPSEDFLDELLDGSNGVKHRSLPFVLILDHPEALFDDPSSKFARVLFNHHALSLRGWLKIITISRVPWSKWKVSSPLQLGFAGVSKDDMIGILCERSALHERLVRMFVEVAFPVCNDVQSLASWLKERYNSSALNEEMKRDERGTCDRFKSTLESFAEKFFFGVNEGTSLNDFEGDDFDNWLFLPERAKIVLVVAFCISRNRRTTDGQFFTKARCKIEKKKKMSAAGGSTQSSQAGTSKRTVDKEEQHTLKPFPIQRLLFCYLSFVLETQIAKQISYDIHEQVNQLCSMGYLVRASSAANMDSPKFLCIAPFAVVNHIASTLHVNLREYLQDSEQADDEA